MNDPRAFIPIAEVRALLEAVRWRWFGGQRCWCYGTTDEDFKAQHEDYCVRAHKIMGEWTEAKQRWRAIYDECVARGEHPGPKGNAPLYRSKHSIRPERAG